MLPIRCPHCGKGDCPIGQVTVTRLAGIRARAGDSRIVELVTEDSEGHQQRTLTTPEEVYLMSEGRSLSELRIVWEKD